MFWGAAAGVTSFISHTGGPPFQIYTLPMRMTPAVYAGTTPQNADTVVQLILSEIESLTRSGITSATQ